MKLLINLEKLKEIYSLSAQLRLVDARDLIKNARSFSFKKKEILIDEGSNKNEMFFIRKGLVRCYTVNEKGEEITFRLIKENNIVTNADVILYNQSSRFKYEAIENTKVFSIDFEELEKILVQNRKLESNRKHIAQHIMRELHTRVESFVLFTPEERYLNFIRENPDLSNRVPDKYIASVLGITPVSLSRIRRRIASQKNS